MSGEGGGVEEPRPKRGRLPSTRLLRSESSRRKLIVAVTAAWRGEQSPSGEEAVCEQRPRPFAAEARRTWAPRGAPGLLVTAPSAKEGDGHRPAPREAAKL